jgi:hypothetical protein
MSQKQQPKKKKKGTRGWVIPFVIFSIFVFTAVAVWVQLVIHIELSATLITCFYAFCTGELWMLASIEKTKIKNHYDLDNDGIIDSEDDHVDLSYIQEAEAAINKLKEQMNNKSEG